MKITKLFKMAMAIGLCVALASCSDGDDGGSGECNCNSQPVIEKDGLTLSLENKTEQRPANVSVLFKVETDGGNPVTDLKSDNVRIFEDNALISEFESQQEILPKPGKFTSHTLLLLDLSGSVLESESLQTLKNAARNFVIAMMPTADSENFGEMDMGVWWFDGAYDIHQLISFDTDSNKIISGIDSITEDISNDTSTNLYGAIIEGINRLKGMVVKKDNMVSVGSLVIFTDGKDQAARKTKEDALNAVKNADKNISVYTIGLGGEIDQPILQEVGKDGFVSAADIQELVPKFKEIADKIREDVQSYYLLEYCSPKRKGSHDLKITIDYTDEYGRELSGSLTTCFCASGFEGGCVVSSETAMKEESCSSLLSQSIPESGFLQ